MKRIKRKTKYNKHENDGYASSSSTTAIGTESSSTMEQRVADGAEESIALLNTGNEVAHQQLEQIFWSKSTNEEDKTREEEFDEYLADLLL